MITDENVNNRPEYLLSGTRLSPSDLPRPERRAGLSEALLRALHPWQSAKSRNSQDLVPGKAPFNRYFQLLMWNSNCRLAECDSCDVSTFRLPPSAYPARLR
jgi:hypothetical protein